MTACVKCQALRGQPAHQAPHNDLMSTPTIHLEKGPRDLYFCKICGSKLLREADPETGAAVWTIPYEG